MSGRGYVGGVRLGVSGLGGQGGCEPRIEVIVKMQRKKVGLCWSCGGGGGVVGRRVGWGGVGIGGGVGYGECEPIQYQE